MRDSDCGECLACRTENARLKAQVDQLKRRLKVARVVAQNISRRTRDIMNGGNLQRARWAYIKGAHIAAAKILRVMR